MKSIYRIDSQTLYFCCPGCALMYGDDGLHSLPIGEWVFDGDVDSPTITPSVLTKHHDQVCHMTLINGVFNFVDDSTHQLSGQSVPIEDLPSWVEDAFGKKENF